MGLSNKFATRERDVILKNLRYQGVLARSAARLVLDGTDIHADTTVAWQNTTGRRIFVTNAMLDVTTASDGACTLNIGSTAVSATTGSDNLIDGVSTATAGMFDNHADGGTNGKARQVVEDGDWVTVTEASGDATGLEGELLLEFVVRE